jgi:hypothetical protein
MNNRRSGWKLTLPPPHGHRPAMATNRLALRWTLKGPTMPTDPYHDLQPAGEQERAYLESLIREDFERCHPGETLDDIKRRASFSKEDRGLLRDWMALAAKRAAAER